MKMTYNLSHFNFSWTTTKQCAIDAHTHTPTRIYTYMPQWNLKCQGRLIITTVGKPAIYILFNREAFDPAQCHICWQKVGETQSQLKCNQQKSDSFISPFNAISHLTFYFIFIDREQLYYHNANQLKQPALIQRTLTLKRQHRCSCTLLPYNVI